MTETFLEPVKTGDQALQAGDTLVALVQYETAFKLNPDPKVMAKLGYCLAKERQQFQKAASYCRGALQAEPTNADHYYQLGRIHLLGKQKGQAIQTFRKGLKLRPRQKIIDELDRLGVRKDPVFASPPRDHFLNRTLGIFMSRLGAR